MHDTAMASGTTFFNTYMDDGIPASILDLGALDVNGSLRQVAPSNARYVGIDLGEGPGVDIVAEIGAPLPVDKGSFDVVVSTSCFEHDMMPWQTFLNALDALKPNGFLYLNAPSNGPYHAYPYDNWRYYPDAGLAFAQWGRSMGREVSLVESAILPRRSEIWNDFVAVFTKSNAPSPRGRYIVDQLPGVTNIRKGENGCLLNLRAETEDNMLLRESSDEIERLQARIGVLESSVRKANSEIEAVYRSSSWRFTAPLRRLKELYS